MVDKIGRKDIVNKIDYLIENLPQNQNFCLALNGSWGSGKTFVIELLKEKLKKHPEYIVVHYDAWKNNFYSDPLIAMLYCILDTLEQATVEDVFEPIKLKKVKKTALTVAAEMGGAVVEAISEKVKIVGLIKDAIEKIKTVIKAYKETAFTNNPEVEKYKSYASFLGQTIAQINEITAQEFLKDKQTRLIVLVDEIDRCLPNEQLIVLEKLHHLFDVKNCAVIVALNKEAIHKNFEKNFGGNSEDYLRKFFQYNFELSTSAVILLKNRLVDLFYEINDKREEALIEKSVNFIIDDVVQVASEIISQRSNSKPIDNRDIDKFISDGSCILNSIVNYHPALLWFTLRILLYRMFRSDLFKNITDETSLNAKLIEGIEQYLGANKQTVTGVWNVYYNDYFGEMRYRQYSNSSYNDLLFLFNLCKCRDNEQKAKQYTWLVSNITFDIYRRDPTLLVEKLKTILLEMERYGN